MIIGRFINADDADNVDIMDVELEAKFVDISAENKVECNSDVDVIRDEEGVAGHALVVGHVARRVFKREGEWVSLRGSCSTSRFDRTFLLLADASIDAPAASEVNFVGIVAISGPLEESTSACVLELMIDTVFAGADKDFLVSIS